MQQLGAAAHTCLDSRRWPSDTVLDHYGVVRVHVLAIAGGTIDCNDEVWASIGKTKSRTKK